MDGLDRKLWGRARALVIARDQRCSVAPYDADVPCSDGPLHVHHVEPGLHDPYDPDALYAVCAAHHARWEALIRCARN